MLTLDSQLVKARSARDAAQRNLDALRRLQHEGAASAGEVKQAEDVLRQAQADATLLEQKKKDRYSRPEVAKVQALGAEAQAAYDRVVKVLDLCREGTQADIDTHTADQMARAMRER